jgi:hypothetical protein
MIVIPLVSFRLPAQDNASIYPNSYSYSMKWYSYSYSNARAEYEYEYEYEYEQEQEQECECTMSRQTNESSEHILVRGGRVA